MNDSDILIVGGGFPGIYLAWRALQAGMRPTLVEASDRLGGNLRSFRWRGHDVDWGAHNLDLRSERTRDFFGFILGDRLREIPDHRWGSLRDRIVTPGFEFPDFSDDPALCTAVLDEMTAIKAAGAAAPDTGTGWLEHYRADRGRLLARAVAPMVKKFTGIDPRGFDATAESALGYFARPRLGSDAQMAQLKGSAAFWDDRLGVTLACTDARFVGRPEDRRFGYPAEGGIGGFGAAALERLQAEGATVLLERRVQEVSATRHGVRVVAGDSALSARGLFWSLPRALLVRALGQPLPPAPAAVRVGCRLLVWEVERADILGPHYLHDFGTGRRAFRYSAPGTFLGGDAAAGLTCVMAEIPGPPEALAEADPEADAQRCFAEMRDIGYLRPKARPRATTSQVIASAFALPLRAGPGLARTRTETLPPRVWAPETGLRGRVAFMDYCDRRLMPEILTECATP